jgi:23S rRNA (cytidine1920-2'-O)/16S rRNA (cytidine1409-2'-O)-methyltransferase
LAKALRLDAELVRRGLVRSRSEAKLAIEAGRVLVGGMPAARPATMVTHDDALALTGPPRRFVSRGGDKLDSALSRLEVRVAGRRWLDVGASTGGFTDRLLEGGALEIVALDVGYGQLDWSLRTDDRVTVLERINARNLTPEHLPWPPDGIVADLSFISLTVVLPALARVGTAETDYVLLVKPQFEVGRSEVSRGGVVRDPALWHAALQRVVDTGNELGLGLAGACPSAPAGPAGNREFFVHFRRGARTAPGSLSSVVTEVTVNNQAGEEAPGGTERP